MNSLAEHWASGFRSLYWGKFLAALIALLYVLMSHASMVSTSHDPANWSGHDNAPLLAAQSGDHGHSHDDPQTDDRSAGHQHGTHTPDHSHDNSNLPRSDTDVVARLPDVWVSIPPALAYPEPCFSFERPPKSLLMS